MRNDVIGKIFQRCPLFHLDPGFLHSWLIKSAINACCGRRRQAHAGTGIQYDLGL